MTGNNTLHYTYLFLGLIFLFQSAVFAFSNQQPHKAYSISRCKAACLHECTSYFLKNNDDMSKMAGKQIQLHPDLIVDTCERYKIARYSNCEEACVSDLKFKECTEMCRSKKPDRASMMCLVGCRNIHRFMLNRIGNCPKERVPLQLGSSTCFKDLDCPVSKEKCCPNICVKPVFSNDLPDHADPILSENRESRSFDMRWRYKMNVTYPILFLIQVRTYFGQEFDIHKAGPWRNLVETTKNAVQIDDLQVGRHYQFRLAAVSALGTLGFGQTTPPVILSIHPRAPSPPRNFNDGVWSIHANGIINIQLKWDSPRQTSLPISFYKIRWSVDHGYIQTDGKPLESVIYFEKIIPGTQLNYTVQNLSSELTYKIQVSAISNWGSKTFVSSPNTVFLTTPKLIKATSSSGYTQSDGACRCDGSTHVASGLDITQPLFSNGKLFSYIHLPKLPSSARQARIEWMPRVCIETESSTQYSGNGKRPPFDQNSGSRVISMADTQPFLMSNLRFNCHYSVRIIPLSSFPLFKPANVSGCFCTPSCSHVHLTKGAAMPDNCRVYEPIRPTAPSKITYERVSPLSASYNISWSPYNQSYIMSGVEIRYRVVWGPSKDPFKQSPFIKGMPSLTPRLDLDNAETKVLRKNMNWIILSTLKKNKRYIIKIETVIKYGDSENSSPEKILYLATDNEGNLKNIFPVAMQFTNQPNETVHPALSELFLVIFLCLISMFTYVKIS